MTSVRRQSGTPTAIHRASRYVKAFHQLGPQALALYGRYKYDLHSGALRRATPPITLEPYPPGAELLLTLPDRRYLMDLLGEHTQKRLVEQADQITAGRVSLFGGEPVPLSLEPTGPLLHWTEYELGRQAWGVEDVKFIWEPARFGWAYNLGRAYHLTGDERYPHAFWELTERFLEKNPPNLGPNYASGQEVALRILAFVFALRIFSASEHSTCRRKATLAAAIASHAARIPPSLAYARAQNNNHLLVEAAGMYTAGLALPSHPEAEAWQALGWRWFHSGLQAQIDHNGAYVQHSANYQRLMLQISLWMYSLAMGEEGSRKVFPPKSQTLLAASTRWLLSLVDPDTGRVPNLGPNDGAYILPLSACPYDDYRPVLQAAALAFLGERCLPPGEWDEMALWFNCPSKLTGQTSHLFSSPSTESCPHVLRSPAGNSWAYLRVARFSTRPGHADQLHLDLWWRGLNVAQDAGTYRYNAPGLWENALSGSAVHNTLTVDGLDQMSRTGRFLWLDWAQANLVDSAIGSLGDFSFLAAEHNGYRSLDLVHRREITAQADGCWRVVDRLLPTSSSKKITSPSRVRLHWLLPDWPWRLENPRETNHPQVRLHLQSPLGWILLVISGEANTAGEISPQLVRAGELLSGSGPFSPTWGWFSPTYAHKVPALSFSVELVSTPPVSLDSEWVFPDTI